MPPTHAALEISTTSRSRVTVVHASTYPAICVHRVWTTGPLRPKGLLICPVDTDPAGTGNLLTAGRLWPGTAVVPAAPARAAAGAVFGRTGPLPSPCQCQWQASDTLHESPGRGEKRTVVPLIHTLVLVSLRGAGTGYHGARGRPLARRQSKLC